MENHWINLGVMCYISTHGSQRTDSVRTKNKYRKTSQKDVSEGLEKLAAIKQKPRKVI